MRRRGITAAAVFGLGLFSFSFGDSLSQPAAHAQGTTQGLVIAGEEIANAALFAAAKREGRLVMFSAFPADALKTVTDAFQMDSGLKVDIIRLTTERLYPRVIAEHTARRLTADYIDLTDLTLTKELADKGILDRPHKVPAFDAIPASIKDANGRWYAFYRPVSSIGVNAAIVKEADQPKVWRDLLDPKWRGRIGLQSIDVGGSAFTLNYYLRAVYDPEFWTKLAGQSPRIYPGVAPAVTDMIRGETSLVAFGAPPLVTQIAQGAPVRIIPSDGLPSFPVSGGIPVSSKNPNAAMVLLNWLTSKRGGEVIGSAGAYPVNPAAPAPRPSGVVFPAADKVWNIKVEDWEKARVSYSEDWRKAFGQH
jgi:iron(III) transport system substrate-binding protein